MNVPPRKIKGRNHGICRSQTVVRGSIGVVNLTWESGLRLLPHRGRISDNLLNIRIAIQSTFER